VATLNSSEYILTLDAGTGGGRAVLFDCAGKQVGSAHKEWLPKTILEYPGSQVFDTREAWETLTYCIKKVVAEANISPTQIIGISATSMREGMVLYDKDGTEIWACPNIDARAAQEVIELLENRVAERFYNLGGDWLAITSPARFRWIQKHEPAILEGTAHVNMISDWIIFKLSGNIVTDPTVGSSSGLFNLHERNWSSETISLCSLPQSIFPPIYEPATVVGELSKAAAMHAGLKEGTPVVTAGADTQMALLGMGSISPGTWGLVGGTFWQLAAISSYPAIDQNFRLRTLCHVTPCSWMTEGIAFLIGQQARWFRDGFCQPEVEKAHLRGENPYHLMEKLAAAMPIGANGVLALFSNIQNSRTWKHPSPSFLNFAIYDPARTGRAACIRALWESAAYVTYGHLSILREITGSTPERITFSGGSASGFLWPSIVADVLGTDVLIPTVKETACLGAAMCVAVATGRFRSLHEAAEDWVTIERTVESNLDNHHQYMHHYERWKRVLDESMSLVDRNLVTPMWRAPGA